MPLDLSIYQLVRNNLPADFVVSDEYLDIRLKYWQLFLYEAAGVDEDDIYNILAWTDSWVILLSYCILYDIYVKIVSGKFIAYMGSGSEGDAGSGDIKKITTGPTEVEYHNSADNLKVFLSGFLEPGGFMDLFMQEACAWASRVAVKLPFCHAKKLQVGLMIGKRPIKGKRYYAYITKKAYGQAYKPSSMG